MERPTGFATPTFCGWANIEQISLLRDVQLDAPGYASLKLAPEGLEQPEFLCGVVFDLHKGIDLSR